MNRPTPDPALYTDEEWRERMLVIVRFLKRALQYKAGVYALPSQDEMQQLTINAMRATAKKRE